MQHWILTLFIITTCMASYAACARQATETPPLASGVYNFQGAPFDNWTLVGLQDPRVTGLDIYCTWSELEPSAGAPRWDWLERTCEPWWSRGKQVALRVSTGGHRAQGTPEWVFQKGVRRITAGAPFADFERDTDGFELMSGASRTETASPPAAGKAVIRAARRGAFLGQRWFSISTPSSRRCGRKWMPPASAPPGPAAAPATGQRSRPVHPRGMACTRRCGNRTHAGSGACT